MLAVLLGLVAPIALQGRTFEIRPSENFASTLSAIRAKRGNADSIDTLSVHAGLYEVPAGLKLGASDSNLRIVAAGDGPVRIVGGKKIGGWSTLVDGNVLSKLPSGARGVVLVSNLRSQGLTNYGALTRHDPGVNKPAPMELFVDGLPMTLARWPNAGWAAVTGAPDGPTGAAFTYQGSEPAKLEAEPDLWVHGYWGNNWADSTDEVTSIDPGSHTIQTAAPHGVYGYKKGGRFAIINALRELDSPGEYYIDRSEGRMYLWPPSGFDPETTIVSTSDAPIISISGAKNIELKGLTIGIGRGAGIKAQSCDQLSITACSITDVGGTGVEMDNCRNSGIRDSDVTDAGEYGVVLNGGDRRTLQGSGMFASNDRIWSCGRWERAFRPAVELIGDGFDVNHNEIHDMAHMAILLKCNDAAVQSNVISRVCTETGDAGAIYTGRNPTQLGNVIRGNLLENIEPSLRPIGPDTWVCGVYLDDLASGVKVLSNTFDKVFIGVNLGGGSANEIEANSFVDCDMAVQLDARGLDWAAAMAAPGGSWDFDRRVSEVDASGATYRSRYPELSTILSGNIGTPKGNTFANNLVIARSAVETRVKATRSDIRQEGNLVRSHNLAAQGATPSTVVEQLRQQGASKGTTPGADPDAGLTDTADRVADIDSRLLGNSGRAQRIVRRP